MFFLLLGIAAANAEATPAKDVDPVVCVRQSVGSEVGTHMRPKKVCRPKSEWDFIEKHTQETMQSMTDRGKNPGRADGHAAPPR